MMQARKLSTPTPASYTRAIKDARQVIRWLVPPWRRRWEALSDVPDQNPIKLVGAAKALRGALDSLDDALRYVNSRGGETAFLDQIRRDPDTAFLFAYIDLDIGDGMTLAKLDPTKRQELWLVVQRSWNDLNGFNHMLVCHKLRNAKNGDYMTKGAHPAGSKVQQRTTSASRPLTLVATIPWHTQTNLIIDTAGPLEITSVIWEFGRRQAVHSLVKELDVKLRDAVPGPGQTAAEIAVCRRITSILLDQTASLQYPLFLLAQRAQALGLDWCSLMQQGAQSVPG